MRSIYLCVACRGICNPYRVLFYRVCKVRRKVQVYGYHAWVGSIYSAAIESSCQQDPSIFVIDDDFFILERIFASNKFKNNQASTSTGYLAYSAHEEISIEVLSPSSSSLCEPAALAEGLLVGMIIARHDA